MDRAMDSEGWDRRYEGREPVWTVDPNRFLVTEIEALAPDRAIDLVCGEGRNAVWLAEHGCHAVGGQLERLLAGTDPPDLGEAPMRSVPAAGPLLERVHTLLIAAAARQTAGYPADEPLELACLACAVPADHPDAVVAASVRELPDRRAAYLATNPPQRAARVPGIHLMPAGDPGATAGAHGAR